MQYQTAEEVRAHAEKAELRAIEFMTVHGARVRPSKAARVRLTFADGKCFNLRAVEAKRLDSLGAKFFAESGSKFESQMLKGAQSNDSERH